MRYWKGKKFYEDNPYFLKADRWINVYQYFNVDEHCRPLQYSVRISEAPSNGKIIIKDAEFRYPETIRKAFAAIWGGVPDSRRNCVMESFQSKLVIYEPDHGFTGKDHAAVEIINQGLVSTEAFTFYVRAQ